MVNETGTIITEENLGEFLKILRFQLKDTEENTWHKKYTDHNNYEIIITINQSFSSSKINYGNKITIGRQTTTNFSQQENFVILECINRLLETGYAPESIILEKSWKEGHKEGGQLDIQIIDEKKRSFLMVECKTWGMEYKKYVKQTYIDGSQLFGYFNHDRNTNFLCLYTSCLDANNVIYKNSIIKVTEEIKDSTNSQEAFENWKPQIFETNGLFEKNTKPYLLQFTGLKKKDLIPLTKEDGGDIFNRFAEILRRNVVSDKTNAYNKIFNLFLCKIVDEYKTNNEDGLKFQWGDGESNEEVLLRLNDLYKEGMSEYLNLDISSVDMAKVERQLNFIKTEKDKEIIRQMFIEQKLYTSNDFAFKEVFDKKTFDLNCIVVKEVVKLLERYKIKYDTKQQFLGDFFESLLNTGIKQEVGQFFTPVPITHFICSSLPTKEIIHEKNSNKETFILPYVLDYASGSGHFITEMMESINYYVEGIEDNFFNNAHARQEFNKTKNNLDWAEEYIYGIEKDYRLAKTTKIATFLNGDGEATIIFGDGLDSFYNSDDYIGKLKSNNKTKDNQSFDIIVTNPPYAVDGFKTTLKYGKECFELYKYLSDKSNEIECLFLERAKQLLKVGGVAGIILPSSILSNTGLKTKTRELILKYFEIIGLVELGSKTFMKTGTNTIILFVKRLDNDFHKEIKLKLDEAIKNKRDITINQLEHPIATFIKKTYELTFNDFISILNNNPTNVVLESDIFKEYKVEFDKSTNIKYLVKKKDFVKLPKEDKEKILMESLCKHIIDKETEKLFYFILTYHHEPVLVKVPKSATKQRDFLGYKFSERRGEEGLKYINDEKTNSLYDDDYLENPDKVNSYIRNAFLHKKTEISEELSGRVFYQKLYNIMDFSNIAFEKQILLNPKVEFESKFPKVKLYTQFKVQKGKSITASKISKGEVPVIAGGKTPAYYHNKSNRAGKIITVSGSGANAGYVAYFDTPIFASDCSTMESINEKEAKIKYLYYLLSLNQNKIYYLQRGNAQPHVYPTDLENLYIPLPPEEVQNKIIDRLNKFDVELNILKNKTDKLNEEREKIINNLFNSHHPKSKISTLCEVVRGGSPRPKGSSKYFSKTNTGIHWISISDLTKYKRGKYITNTDEFLTPEGKEKSRYLEKGELVLTNSGTVGKPAFLGINGCIHDGYLAFINFTGEITKDYLYYILSGLKEHMEDLAPEGSQKNLNTTLIGNLEIPVIKSKSEQEKITKVLDKIVDEIESNSLKIKEIINSQKEILNNLI